MPELAGEAQSKTARPLYAAVVRIATRAPEYERAWEIAKTLSGSLRIFARPNGNELIPLRNDEYPFFEHIEDVLYRRSRRCGMLLNVDELLGFVHFPGSEVHESKLLRQTTKSKPAPGCVTDGRGVLVGYNVHLGRHREVRLVPEQRVRHTHVIGASGTGKSTLLFNLIRQDIEAGEGVGVLDPHGDLVDQVLGNIPPERIDDVILLDASDEEYSVGFNILSAHSDLEKTLLASDLVSVFKRLSSAWGDQLGSVLNNAILAFLESKEGGTLADLRRFLLEPAYREKFLQTVTDPDIVYYWRKGFTQLSGNKSVGPVLTRLETFLSPKPIRYMVSQKSNRLDFGNILTTGKIFLAKLSQGAIGNENAYLLGSLLMAKFQQTAMARQRERQSDRRDFWLYLDEFHNFITPSMAEILSSARKYRLGLTLGHQEMVQLQRDRDVASAVMSNCHTRICFRVGDQDARALESGFSYFEARDLQNLSVGETICRVERSDFDFNLSVPPPELPPESELAANRNAVIAASRLKYATPRVDIEETRTRAPEQECPPIATLAGIATVPSPLPVPGPQPPKPPPPSVRERPNAVSAVHDTGRGGAQHKSIQQRLKKAAEELGYKADVELSVLDNRGSVDLALNKSGRSIACEISLTTTIDHEVGNVIKCLKAGFPTVAVVCIDQSRLALIKTAISGSIDPAQATQVSYYLPEGLIECLRETAAKDTMKAPKDERRLGYKIKRTFPVLSADEAKAREAAAIATIADAMRKKS